MSKKQTWLKGEFSYPGYLKKLAKHKDFVKQAIEWLTDCEWGDVDENDIRDMHPLVITRAVQLHYHGGVKQFIKDGLIL